MLRIDLTRAELEPVSFHETVAVLPEQVGEDVVRAGDVLMVGVVERAGSAFFLTAEVKGSAQLRCARCLGAFPFSFSEEVELRLLPEDGSPKDEELRLGRSDLEVHFYRDACVDLVEVAGEQLALAVPMKPLCGIDCRGLCPRCGANLNQGPCGCPTDVDLRLAPLLEWRKSE